MSVSEWKKVNLYNLTTFPNFKKGQTKADITAVCYNDKQKIFCDGAGYINVYFKNWDSMSFRATNSAIILCQVTPDSNVLVTLSYGESKDTWLLKVFSLNKLNKRTGAPCVGAANLSTASTPTALAAYMLGTQMYISVGFQKGDIWLYRAPLARDMSANFQCNIITSWPITGMAFHRVNNVLHMFVCSDGGIFLYTINDNNSLSDNKVVLDGSMTPARCCALLTSIDNPYFVVGRDDALYCFTSDGRGPCYAIEGVKSHIAALHNNLVVVLKNNNTADTDTVIIVNTTNKIIMLSKQIPCVRSIMTDKNECYILTRNGGELFYIRELVLENKLRILCEKNLYNVALRFVDNADEGERNEEAIANINLKYGDNLLLKGDLKEAVDKYIQTLGYIEPYDIIQKLMDSRYTKYLTRYLNALASRGLAEPEHVELLHNCNERLNLPTKLHNMYPDLIFNSDSKNDDDEDNNHNDVKSWNIKNGISLNSFLKTLAKAPTDLVHLFAQASEEQIYDFFLEHGQLLLAQHAIETVEVLKKLCDEATGIVRQPERFLSFLIFDEAQCIDFLAHVTAERLQCSKSLNNTLFELRLRAWQKSPQTVSSIDLLDFLKEREEFLSYEQALILCRIYCFWPGLKYLFNNPMHVTTRSGSAKEENGYVQMLLKTLNQGQSSLHGDGIGRSSHLFANLLNDMLDDKNQSILQILHNLCNNRNILVKNVKEFFSHEHFSKNSNHLQQENDKVKQMLQNKEELQNLLDQYLQLPIEFRSSICDICKQQLKPPSIYFLCQHSFHKECLAAYSENEFCVVCKGNKKSQQTVFPELLDSDGDLHKTNDEAPLTTYTDMLYKGIFDQARNNLIVPKRVMKVDTTTKSITLSNHLHDGSNQWNGRFTIDSIKPKIITTATNPFEKVVQPSNNPFEEYDNNLNPFNE